MCIPAALISEAKSVGVSVLGVGACITCGYICMGAKIAAVCMYSISSLLVVRVRVGG